MKDKQMISCPVCETRFIPRTFYPEEAIFTSSDGKKLSPGFNGYMNYSGIKPPEVILGFWITYCPSCNYILKFAKEIVRKEKIIASNITSNDVADKYNNYYFGFPFGDYSQYLKEVTRKVEDQIEAKLQDLDIDTWENLYKIDDHFKFLVRLFANLENYCNTKLGFNNDRDMSGKIKKLKLPKDVEISLLQLNNIKNEIVKGDYDLAPEEKEIIGNVLIKFVFYLFKKHIKPIVDTNQLNEGYEFINIRDLQSEVKSFLSSYLHSRFNSNVESNKHIKIFVENLFEEK